MNGLIIKKKWLDLIISKQKTAEIRGSKTSNINKQIYLLESGTQLIRGICTITDVVSLDENAWEEYRSRHCVDISFEELKKRYSHPYAWILSEVEPVAVQDLRYKHPKGAVIWVKDVEKLS